MKVAVEVVGKSDVGCVRTNNEDNFGYDTRSGIFLVCDGMGGMAAGEVASKMGVDTVLEYFRKATANGNYPAHGRTYEDLSQMANALASAIQLANDVIYQAASSDASHHGMGATIVAAMLKGNFLSIAHVGDSRIYRIRQGQIEQMTEDHSLVAEQVRRGLLSQEEADRSDIQNIIFRALGADATVEPDLEDLVAQPGDILLLTTDGLTKYIKEPRLLEIIQSAYSLQQACDRLIQAAKEAGGDDNITCVLIKIIKEPWYRRWFGGGHKWQSSI